MAYYLGIDGGGTKTTCVIGDASSVLATALSGPSNIVRVGEAEARRSLRDAIQQACTAAGLSPQQIAGTCIGAAGADRSTVIEALREILSEIVAGEIEVVGDMQIALDAAFSAGAGIIVIAGTGSIAYGRNTTGQIARAGGWGFAVSDEGSAHWIGKHSVAALLRERDLSSPTDSYAEEKNSQPTSPLFQAIQSAWGIASFDDLVRAANASPGPDFAALLPFVIHCAEAGDELSRRLLSRAAEELAQLASIIANHLFLSEPNSNQPIPVAMIGGVFCHSQIVRELFYNRLTHLHPTVELSPEVVEPVFGALRRARNAESRR